MRRPLAMFCMAVLLAVGFSLAVSPPAVTRTGQQENAMTMTGYEGQRFLVKGTIYKTETKSYYGAEQTLLYLKQIQFFITENSSEQNQTKHQKQLPKGLICSLKGGKENSNQFYAGREILLQGIYESFETASNPGNFNAALYYAIEGYEGRLKKAEVAEPEEIKWFTGSGKGLTETADIRKKLAGSLQELEEYLEKKLRFQYPEKEAGILTAMLLGNRTDLDGEIRELYQNAGILHILSVSGLHVSFLGYGLYRLLRRAGLPGKVAAVLGILFMLLYGNMIGMGVSVFRSIVMFCFQMTAKLLGRTYDLLTALAVAALLLILQNPLYFYHSGFWLSFTCVLAICLLYPKLKLPGAGKPKPEVPEKKKLSGKIGEIILKAGVKGADSMLLGISVMAATLPVLLWFYYQVSLWGILWNVVVVPLAGLVLGLGVLGLILPVGEPFLSPLVVWFNCRLLGVFEGVSRWSEQTGSGTFITGQPSFTQVLLYAGCLCGLLWLLPKIRYGFRFLLLLLPVVILLYRPPRNFSVTFLDVGQGDCICVQNRNGNTYLIDGGSSSRTAVGTYTILPFLKQQGIHTLQAVFLSHADADHINGIEELLKQQKGGIRIQKVIIGDRGEQMEQEEYAEVLKLCAQYGTEVYSIRSGQTLQDGALYFACLHPEKECAQEGNASSMVLMLQYEQQLRVFLTGDIEGDGERHLLEEWEKLVPQLPPAHKTILKVAHHGSANSTSEQLLDSLKPDLAVISCGRNNRYGHPHTETLKRLQDAGIPWLSTRDCGAIETSLPP